LHKIEINAKNIVDLYLFLVGNRLKAGIYSDIVIFVGTDIFILCQINTRSHLGGNYEEENIGIGFNRCYVDCRHGLRKRKRQQ